MPAPSPVFFLFFARRQLEWSTLRFLVPARSGRRAVHFIQSHTQRAGRNRAENWLRCAACRPSGASVAALPSGHNLIQCTARQAQCGRARWLGTDKAAWRGAAAVRRRRVQAGPRHRRPDIGLGPSLLTNSTGGGRGRPGQAGQAWPARRLPPHVDHRTSSTATARPCTRCDTTCFMPLLFSFL